MADLMLGDLEANRQRPQEPGQAGEGEHMQQEEQRHVQMQLCVREMQGMLACPCLSCALVIQTGHPAGLQG